MQRRPWQSNEERLVDESLEALTVPAAALAQLGPPLPQIDPWRPRMGYGTIAQRTPDIMLVINTDRNSKDYRTSFSGSVGSYTGSSVSSNPLG
jgi:hypothetical protein